MILGRIGSCESANGSTRTSADLITGANTGLSSVPGSSSTSENLSRLKSESPVTRPNRVCLFCSSGVASSVKKNLGCEIRVSVWLPARAE